MRRHSKTSNVLFTVSFYQQYMLFPGTKARTASYHSVSSATQRTSVRAAQSPPSGTLSSFFSCPLNLFPGLLKHHVFFAVCLILSYWRLGYPILDTSPTVTPLVFSAHPNPHSEGNLPPWRISKWKLWKPDPACKFPNCCARKYTPILDIRAICVLLNYPQMFLASWHLYFGCISHMNIIRSLGRDCNKCCFK